MIQICKRKKKRKKYGIQIYESPDAMLRTKLMWFGSWCRPVKLLIKRLRKFLAILERDAIIIDGGNSHFTDSMRRAKELQLRGIHFLDCGASGGIHGENMVLFDGRR